MEVKTKYSAGDTVYSAEANGEAKWIQCPDCLGTQSWKAITPAGEEIAIECPACHRGYECTGVIEEWSVDGTIYCFTIASVQFDSSEAGTKYMCQETGVGSGRVWNEEDLYASREEAEVVLPHKIAVLKRSRQEWAAKNYARRKGDRPGSMAAYYRKEIRDAKKKVKQAQDGLERQKGEAQ